MGAIPLALAEAPTMHALVGIACPMSQQGEYLTQRRTQLNVDGGINFVACITANGNAQSVLQTNLRTES